jgi:hypothetical protein
MYVCSSCMTELSLNPPALPHSSQLQYRGARGHSGTLGSTLGDREFIWSLTAWMARSDARYEQQRQLMEEQSKCIDTLTATAEALLAHKAAHRVES